MNLVQHHYWTANAILEYFPFTTIPMFPNHKNPNCSTCSSDSCVHIFSFALDNLFNAVDNSKSLYPYVTIPRSLF